ncbi:MAG: two-component sensor histidine kinase [Burkholderiales bacterium RIFCSPHIGHO2_12_FULL_65_48]|nr:MAG: two-component sensor histidine kinase [Burkholderiales bacterium RIFCSPHIGHO2_02_FULL_64_19]OGB15286.1 MAG: two-component sensor histidine kinase [Burkholderiales bacterium RIFCSPHIGHO2_12_FULL_65_48]OGB59221.1 MAG: two-component sensor histidine kinase [Burkholderiales bacterium RIFCSPLOWO2_12_FULL_64_33]
MTPAWRRRLPSYRTLHLPSLLLWAVVACTGASWLAVARLQQLHAAFETDARIVHRLLSQRVVQHDAIMATLALLQPTAAASNSTDAASPLPRLPSVYPQILAVLQRTAQSDWPPALQAELAAAEASSRRTGHAAMAGLNLPAGRYHLVLAGTPASYALHIDLRSTIPMDEWPMDRSTSPVRVTLERDGEAFVVQPGRSEVGAWSRTYEFHKLLAAQSQPLDVVARRSVGLHELPWWGMLGWCVLTAALWAAGHALWRQRVARQRAEELLRLGQVARLNTLGELAAGMAHELNQPLTALLSSTQAAQRLLADEPPDLDTAQTAMARAVEQARRASTVVGRLRRLVERPDLAGQAQPLALPTAVHDALHLLEPELAQRGVVPSVTTAPDLPTVLAEPVALQQIIHNLLMNALQALEQVPATERQLHIALARTDTGHVALSVRDHGPGIPPEARQRLFEPFYTTRTGGLGLGLTLCDSLAQAMGAQLALAPEATAPAHDLRGAEFVLTLPTAPPAHDR